MRTIARTSTRWSANLVRRERQRQEQSHAGLMVGDEAALFAFQDVVRRRRPALRVTVVQPGLSKRPMRGSRHRPPFALRMSMSPR